jgi:uncharacterized membrane protein YagU involved in acid resistance
MQRLLAGIVAGAAATVPMTLVMAFLDKYVTAQSNRPVPPYEITMNAVRDLNLAHVIDEPGERTALTTVAHFGFGAAMGGLYALMLPKQGLSTGLRGALYGAGVWAGNYVGALPALGLYRPPQWEPASRQAATIAAHLVWGPVMALMFEQLTPKDFVVVQR